MLLAVHFHHLCDSGGANPEEEPQLDCSEQICSSAARAAAQALFSTTFDAVVVECVRDTLAEIYLPVRSRRAVIALALRVDGRATRDRKLVLRLRTVSLAPAP